MDNKARASGQLAAAITKSASKQTYYTIRFLVDRGRVEDAYRAYGYFRWVDNVVDAEAGTRSEKTEFIQRQQSILESGYRGEIPADLCAEEWMLADLIRHDTEPNSGLQIYLRNMMDVMAFDAGRRGRVVSQMELAEYSHKLAMAVTEALHYFIGHDEPSPRHEARYLAVNAAHIVHMLRDAMEDIEAGYYNVPREYLALCGIAPQNVTSDAHREWVCGRVQLARGYFKMARECTAQVRNWRLRLAGFAYTARFEWMLDAIERDHYCLRCEYPERKSLQAALWMAWSALMALITPPVLNSSPNTLTAQPVRIEKR